MKRKLFLFMMAIAISIPILRGTNTQASAREYHASWEIQPSATEKEADFVFAFRNLPGTFLARNVLPDGMERHVTDLCRSNCTIMIPPRSIVAVMGKTVSEDKSASTCEPHFTVGHPEDMQVNYNDCLLVIVNMGIGEKLLPIRQTTGWYLVAPSTFGEADEVAQTVTQLVSYFYHHSIQGHDGTDPISWMHPCSGQPRSCNQTMRVSGYLLTDFRWLKPYTGNPNDAPENGELILSFSGTVTLE